MWWRQFSGRSRKIGRHTFRFHLTPAYSKTMLLLLYISWNKERKRNLRFVVQSVCDAARAPGELSIDSGKPETKCSARAVARESLVRTNGTLNSVNEIWSRFHVTDGCVYVPCRPRGRYISEYIRKQDTYPTSGIMVCGVINLWRFRRERWSASCTTWKLFNRFCSHFC